MAAELSIKRGDKRRGGLENFLLEGAKGHALARLALTKQSYSDQIATPPQYLYSNSIHHFCCLVLLLLLWHLLANLFYSLNS
jgi:hypothetical protein